MDIAIETLCTVSSNGCSAPTLTERIAAETRYSASLEKALDGPDGVAKAYLAWCMASETDQSEINAETANLATAWANAADQSTLTGLRDLAEVDESAYFEVRLS